MYEDYFEKVEIKSGDDSAARYAWKTIYQAFRYKKIPEDIMKYLTDIIKSRKGNEYKEWRENFFEYYIGMENQLLWEMMNDASYYKSNELFMLPGQVAIAYRNLTWLLSFLEFKNDGEFDKDMYKQTFESFFIRSVNMDVNCNNLNILRYCFKMNSLGDYSINVDLKASNLSKARLSSADLTIADLSGAVLTNTVFKKILIHEFDLPKFDEAIQKYHIELIDPNVICKEEHRGYIYDPETNRMIPPKE